MRAFRQFVKSAHAGLSAAAARAQQIPAHRHDALPRRRQEVATAGQSGAIDAGVGRVLSRRQKKEVKLVPRMERCVTSQPLWTLWIARQDLGLNPARVGVRLNPTLAGARSKTNNKTDAHCSEKFVLLVKYLI
jgi:hypothetical protein